jgi:hypothetical protein
MSEKGLPNCPFPPILMNSRSCGVTHTGAFEYYRTKYAFDRVCAA